MNLHRHSLHGLLLFAGCLSLAAPAWGQLNEDLKLLPNDGGSGNHFGHATAIDSGYVALGARGDDDNGASSGSAYLFAATTGAQLTKLLPNDGAAGDEFACSIAISSGLVVVGARYDDDSGTDSGSAYIFHATSGVQLAKLLPSDGAAGDEFGCAVAIQDGIVAVGAKRDDDNGSDSGAVYLFDASSGAQLSKLLPNDGAMIHNFGEAVDIDAGVLAVGAHGAGFLAGTAYLFDVSTGAQLHKLLPLDTHANMFFGTTIGIDDGVVVVGAWADSIFFDHSGSAYLFDVASGSQISKLIPSDGHDRDHFGFAVAIDAGIVAIGAEEDDDSAFDGGSAYLYDATGTELTKILASDGEAFDVFGSAIAIQGGTIVIGAYGDDDNGDASGSAYLVDQSVSVGTSFCAGDGSVTSCPCGNPGAPGHGCANSSDASGALLSATGSASLANDDLVLRASSSVASAPGLFFQGTNQVAGGQGVVFGDGLRCVGGSIVRLEPVFANAAGSADSGISIATKGAVSAGQTRRYQWWYRDPTGSLCGSGFNLSNAVEITWAP